MIVSTFYYILYGVLYLITAPLRLLADASLSPNLINAVQTSKEYFTSVSAFVPLATLFSILASVLVVEGYIFSYKLIMWVIRKIPGLK